MAANDSTSDERAVPSQEAPEGVALAEGERLLESIPAQDGHRFLLTTERVIYVGGRDGAAGLEFAFLRDITGARVRGRRKERRGLIWGLIGMLAALGVWQVATSDMVGAVGGIVVAAVSVVLLGDYFFRPADMRLELLTGAGRIYGLVGRRRLEEAQRFLEQVSESRASARAADGERTVRRPPRFPAA